MYGYAFTINAPFRASTESPIQIHSQNIIIHTPMSLAKIYLSILITLACANTYAQRLSIDAFEPPLVIIGMKNAVQLHASGGTPPYKFRLNKTNNDPTSSHPIYTITEDGLLIADKTNEKTRDINGGLESSSDSLSGILEVEDASGSIFRHGVLGYVLIDPPGSQEKPWGYWPLGDNHGIDQYLSTQGYLKVELVQQTTPPGVSILEQNPNYFHYKTNSPEISFTANYKYSVLNSTKQITGNFSVTHVGTPVANLGNTKPVPTLAWITLIFTSVGLLSIAALVIRKSRS